MRTHYAVTLAAQIATAALTLAPATAAGLPTDDPTLSPFQETTSTYIDRCEKAASHVEQGNCLSDQIQSLRIRINAEMKKRLAEAEELAADPPSGGKSGAEKVAIVKADRRKAQAAWEAYTKAMCGAVGREISIDGGNGGYIFQGRCEIRHYVARYNEIRSR